MPRRLSQLGPDTGVTAGSPAPCAPERAPDENAATNDTTPRIIRPAGFICMKEPQVGRSARDMPGPTRPETAGPSANCRISGNRPPGGQQRPVWRAGTSLALEG